MYQFVSIIHVLDAVCLILLVLVQQGKGATTGAAFGSGASQTVFGSRGSGSFLLKITIGFVIIFFATSITLNRMASNAVKHVAHIQLPVLPAAPKADLPVNTAPAVATPQSIPAAPPADNTVPNR
ncbi:MAG: preprotein translocase subunit SecG [Gammaproteobacteria bacterium]|nr:preprotein translocase subunit SecG [Gammaproteobacteria bacterium]